MKFHKTRSTTGESKVEIQMTPMLDMIFQLLIFFILTFRPVTDEGQFGVEMTSLPSSANALPAVVPGMSNEQMPPDQVQFNPPFRIRLKAAADGSLAARGIVMGNRALPGMGQLEAELLSIVGEWPEEFEVIIEADPGLRYQHVVGAVNAISQVGIRKINFAAPQPAQPGSG